MTHPIYGSNTIFASWMELCDVSLNLAEDEARNRLYPDLLKLTFALSDEMIATAREIPPE